MKVILFSAMTVNGIIARDNGEEDFLSDQNWKIFSKMAKDSGCLIIGRKTFEKVSKWKDYNFDNIKGTKKIIVSQQKTLNIKKGYIIACSPRDALNKAKALGFKSVVVGGGSHASTSFIKENLIDEIIINIEPIMIGKGIKIFTEVNFEKKLKLINIRKLPEGIVQFSYKVLK